MRSFTRTARILCVDDSSIQLRVLSHFLTRHGYFPHCVESGTRALALLTENPGSFDVLISDYQMPEMDGLSLIRQATYDHLVDRIIFLTSTVEPFDHEMEGGFFHVLTKPFNPKELLAVIEESLTVVNSRSIRRPVLEL